MREFVTSHKKHVPEIGDYLEIDSWNNRGDVLKEGDEYLDESYSGAQFRIDSLNYTDIDFPINITVTGKPRCIIDTGNYRSRVKIEFVRDGEESTWGAGFIYFKEVYARMTE